MESSKGHACYFFIANLFLKRFAEWFCLLSNIFPLNILFANFFIEPQDEDEVAGKMGGEWSRAESELGRGNNNLVPSAFSSFKMAVGESPCQGCQNGFKNSFEFCHVNTMKCFLFVWTMVSDCRKQTGSPDAGNNLRKSHFIMCQRAAMVYKSLPGLVPVYLCSRFVNRDTAYSLRDSESKVNVPLPRTDYYSYGGAVLWNSLPCEVR